MTITMFDTALNNQYPPGGDAYAAYVDGGVGNQPNYAYITSEFPNAHHLSIALFAGDDADALDVEPGAASPSDIPGWYARQRRRGLDRPCIYADASDMEGSVVPVIRAAPILRSAVRLWSAHYTESPHICGPGSCGATSIDMDGTQWTSSALGRTLDQSLLRGDFFGTLPPVPQYTEFDMSKLPVLKQGDSDKPGQFWAVRRLQALVALTGRINSLPAAAVTDDGVFGPATAAGVKALQAHYGLAQDSVCGPATWSVLLTGSSSLSASSTTGSLTVVTRRPRTRRSGPLGTPHPAGRPGSRGHLPPGPPTRGRPARGPPAPRLPPSCRSCADSPRLLAARPAAPSPGGDRVALNYVQISELAADGSGADLNGTAVFTPNVTVYDAGLPLLSLNVPVQAQIVNGQLKSPSGGTLQLLATDNTGLTFAGLTGFLMWTVQVTVSGQAQDPWSFFLPSSPSSADLYSLARTGAPRFASGTAVLNGSSPVAVSAPTVTSSSPVLLTIQSPSGTPGSPYVSSVTPGTGFSVKSTSGPDSSTVAWVII